MTISYVRTESAGNQPTYLSVNKQAQGLESTIERGNHSVTAIEKSDIVVYTAAHRQQRVFLRHCLIRHNRFFSSIFLLVKYQRTNAFSTHA